MLATLTAALLLGAPPPQSAAADKDAPPAKLQLFADDSWYKNQKGEEKDFTGALSRAPAPPNAVIGAGRFNPYRLTMTDDKGKQTEREVYAGAHPELLAPYVGHKVRLTGKAVDTEVEGKTLAEIWPARLELLDAAAPPEKAASPPDHLDLLANDKTYLADATPEKTYVGLLRKKQGDAAGYTLLVDADDHISPWDLHLPSGHYDLLDPYAGQKLKIIGKKVMGFTPGGAAETYILPGRLEVLPAGGEKAKEIKVLAQAEWTPGPSVAADFRAIRSPRELALAHGQPDDRATDTSVQEREAQLASRMFNVESIRWNNDMVIVVSPGAQPTSGYKVEITSLNVENNVLHVHWRVIPPGPDAAVKKEPSHPAEAALTTRFDGEVVFDESPPPARPGK